MPVFTYDCYCEMTFAFRAVGRGICKQFSASHLINITREKRVSGQEHGADDGAAPVIRVCTCRSLPSLIMTGIYG